MVLEEAADVHFAFEMGLGAVDGFGEDSGIGIPLGYSTVVFATVFIVDDKWNDLVTKAFFEHNQSAEAAVTIFEGADALKSDMEIQYIV